MTAMTTDWKKLEKENDLFSFFILSNSTFPNIQKTTKHSSNRTAKIKNPEILESTTQNKTLREKKNSKRIKRNRN